MDALDKIFRVGVVGCGGISGVHIPALKAIGNVRIVAACDIDAALDMDSYNLAIAVAVSA